MEMQIVAVKSRSVMSLIPPFPPSFASQCLLCQLPPCSPSKAPVARFLKTWLNEQPLRVDPSHPLLTIHTPGPATVHQAFLCPSLHLQPQIRGDRDHHQAPHVCLRI